MWPTLLYKTECGVVGSTRPPLALNITILLTLTKIRTLTLNTLSASWSTVHCVREPLLECAASVDVARILWSNSQDVVQLQQHGSCWDLDGFSIHVFLPIRLLGAINRGVLH